MFIVCTFLPKQIPWLCKLSWPINPFLILILQLNALRHVDVVKTTCWSSNRASEWDLSDFERGMVVGARRAGLSISEADDQLLISRVYRE